MDYALLPALLLLTCVLAIIPFAYVSIKQSGQARLLQPAPKERHPRGHLQADLHKLWAAHFGFQWIGGYQFRGLDSRFIAAFRHAEQPVFLAVQLIKGATHYELISVFNREQTLTTTSLDALVPPSPPGSYVQRFPDAGLTELFRRHTAAHDYLLARGHVQLRPHAVRVDRAIVELRARSYAFVTSLPMWPLRTIAWVLISPRKARDRSVPEQLADARLVERATEPQAAAPKGVRRRPA